jgi:hypothetical protein
MSVGRVRVLQPSRHDAGKAVAKPQARGYPHVQSGGARRNSTSYAPVTASARQRESSSTAKEVSTCYVRTL